MYEDFKSQATHPDKSYLEKFDIALANDFDTPKAMATLWDMLKDDSLSDQTKCGTLMAMDDVLDIGLSEDPDEGVKSLGVISMDDLPEDIQKLVDEREAARIARNWPTSDAIRDKLKHKGYEIEDTNHGPKVSRVTSYS
jgi:cysteinyl-tRNA synthetase